MVVYKRTHITAWLIYAHGERIIKNRHQDGKYGVGSYDGDHVAYRRQRT